MRLAFKTSPQGASWPELLALWQAADELEAFESGWTSDHFYALHGAEAGTSRLEGWITLTALAQATRRLRLGTLVTGIHHRHPAVLANMAATLDVISGGRLELGVGAGWNADEAAGYGFELGTPADRSDRFEEACAVLTGLLGTPSYSFAGRYYTLTDARCDPKPVQRPSVPICIGGNGERRTLRTAARYAQHWNFEGESPEQFSHKRDVLHQHCKELGRDPAELTLSVQLRYAGDPVGTAGQAAGYRAAGAELAIVSLPPPLTPDVLAPLADAFAAL